jgi:hypothetical protein
VVVILNSNSFIRADWILLQTINDSFTMLHIHTFIHFMRHILYSHLLLLQIKWHFRDMSMHFHCMSWTEDFIISIIFLHHLFIHWTLTLIIVINLISIQLTLLLPNNSFCLIIRYSLWKHIKCNPFVDGGIIHCWEWRHWITI